MGMVFPARKESSFRLSGTLTDSLTTARDAFNPVRSRIGDAVFDTASKMANVLVDNPDEFQNKKLPIKRALSKILNDMQELDTVVGRTPQLSLSEIFILTSTVTVTAISPYFFGIKVVELLVPAMAAVSAAIGISAEYVGKVAVANGKEVAALAIQGSYHISLMYVLTHTIIVSL
jgi:hypothetical protein